MRSASRVSSSTWSPRASLLRRHFQCHQEARSGGLLSIPRRRPAPSGQVVSFSDANVLDGIIYPHDDPFIVTLLISHATIKHVLIDTRSQVDLISLEALKKMKVDFTLLRPVKSLLPVPKPTDGVHGCGCPDGIQRHPGAT